MNGTSVELRFVGGARQIKLNSNLSVVVNHGPHPGGGRRVSLQKRKSSVSVRVTGRRRTGPPGSGWTDSYMCTNHEFCVSIYYHQKLVKQKIVQLPRRSELLPLFPSLNRIFSSFLIYFITIRVVVDPPPCSCFIFLVSAHSLQCEPHVCIY